MLSVHLEWDRLLFNLLLITQLIFILGLDVKPQKENFTPDYNVYHNLSTLQTTIAKFCAENPDLIRLLVLDPDIHISKEGRRQHVLQIRNFHIKDNTNFTKVLLSFGEHAREFLPVETLLYLLEKLIYNFKNSISEIDLNHVELYIIVISNPDGRFLVERTQNFCWRGTSSGVDLNRNFDWEFGGEGSSLNPHDEEYRGPKPFSEPETNIYRHLSDVIKFDGFLSLHSGIKQIYIPYADTQSKNTGRVPDNIDEMMKLARLLSTSTVYQYSYGNAAVLNEYTADGTVFDFMAGIKKIPFSYAIELWGANNHRGSSCFDLFNPPNEELKTVISNIYPLYVTFFNYVLDWKNRSLNPQYVSQHEDGSVMPYAPGVHESQRIAQSVQIDMPSITPGFILLAILIIATVLIGLSGKYPACRRLYQRRRVVNLRALSSTLSINLFSS